MNTNQSNPYGHTRRSDRYRHPEQDSNYRFDDYGSAARGGYGNESYGGTWGNQGNEMAGSRNVSGRGDTYSTSRNYGNMGSYGGAQGFGSSRGGYPSQRSSGSGAASGSQFESGMGSRQGQSGPSRQRSYGYSSDYDSHGTGYRHDDNPDSLYGSDVSRRFQGGNQDSYDFGPNQMQSRSGMNNSSNYWDRDNFGSSSSGNYGGSEGNYMGSGYNRSARGSGMGDYGSMGSYNSDNYGRGSSSGSNYGSSSGRGGYGQSGYSSGSYGGQQQHDPYARDTENARIHHKDSDYDYDPNHSFDSSKRQDFTNSRNRGRTWHSDYDSGYDRY
ncbi:hypothetical protein [uncultured Pontibacter sp.]|uniref:hypothetical protein n=1 Tax=uncultured Pontibacter sp. TaxID=453356 RepID=UPI0026249111|nr:hypothetical protein [uncultured Pontibacter sp.]